MEEKMLVIQALSEREYLARKIYEKMQKTQFADVVAREGYRTFHSKQAKEKFCEQVQAEYWAIRDLMEQYAKLERAILLTDAQTWIDTSRGRYTVAAALVLRARMRGVGMYGGAGAFEERLWERMEEDYRRAILLCEEEVDAVLADPLNACEKGTELKREAEEFLRELDRKILLSNATTFLEMQTEECMS